MTFTKLQPIARAVVASALAVSASASMAAAQPFDPITGAVAINGTVLTSLGITVITLGNATFSDNTLFLPVAAVSTAIEGGAARVDFGDADGFTLKTQLGSVSFKDFSYDFGTQTLIGDLQGLGFLSSISLQDSGLITAGTAAGNLGTDSLGAVTTQAASRPLYLSASGFTMASDLTNFLTLLELPTSTFPVDQAITSLNVGTPPAPVPEPSTYAMAGVGLVLAGLAAARKKRA